MPKSLTRGIAVLAALAGPGTAGLAVGEDPPPLRFAASFESGGTIGFELAQRDGDRKVRAIQIIDMAADCEGRAGEIDFRIYGSTPVLGDRSFAVRSEDDSGGKALVRGKFSRRFGRAEGVARLRGRFNVQDGRARCTSGKQPFEARSAD